MYFKLISLFVVLTVVSNCISAPAPEPINIEEVGRKIVDWGQKSLPYIQKVCMWVNTLTGQPITRNSPYYSMVKSYQPNNNGIDIRQLKLQYPQFFQFNGKRPANAIPSNILPSIDENEKSYQDGVQITEVDGLKKIKNLE